jgi:hypothetical protein
VATILERWGLRLNRNKVTARWRDRRQLVTGILVNERMAPAHVPHRMLRAILRGREHGRPVHVVRDGKRVELDEAQVRGLLAYWHLVDPGRVP